MLLLHPLTIPTSSTTLSGDPDKPDSRFNSLVLRTTRLCRFLGRNRWRSCLSPIPRQFRFGLRYPFALSYRFRPIITDYLPKRKFPIVYAFSRGILYASTALQCMGCTSIIRRMSELLKVLKDLGI